MLYYLRNSMLTPSEESYDDQRKRIFKSMLLVPSICVVLIFSLSDLFYMNWIEGTISLVFAVFLMVILLKRRQTRPPDGLYRLSLFFFVLLLAYCLFVGGDDGEKFLWIYIFPGCALFALGYTEGILWNLGLYLLSLVILFGDWDGRYPYPTHTIIRFLISFATVMIMTVIYEQRRHQFEQRLLHKHEALLVEQQRLQEAHTHIQRLAITDPLTGLYNRGALFQRLTADLVTASTTQSPLAIILCDLDNFKAINDTYGHLFGDQVLVHTARILHDSVRHSRDWIVRYGGEEFLIVLPQTDEETAVQVADRIQQKMENQIICQDHHTITITASFGVIAVYGATPDIDTITSLLKQVDVRLYQAKQAGRNCVVAAGSCNERAR